MSGHGAYATITLPNLNQSKNTTKWPDFPTPESTFNPAAIQLCYINKPSWRQPALQL
jgi:hypothetical protein